MKHDRFAWLDFQALGVTRRKAPARRLAHVWTEGIMPRPNTSSEHKRIDGGISGPRTPSMSHLRACPDDRLCACRCHPPYPPRALSRATLAAAVKLAAQPATNSREAVLGYLQAAEEQDLDQVQEETEGKGRRKENSHDGGG